MHGINSETRTIDNILFRRDYANVDSTTKMRYNIVRTIVIERETFFSRNYVLKIVHNVI